MKEFTALTNLKCMCALLKITIMQERSPKIPKTFPERDPRPSNIVGSEVGKLTLNQTYALIEIPNAKIHRTRFICEQLVEL